MKTAVRAESFKYLSTFIVIYLLQRCPQTIVRLVSLSVLHFNIFSNPPNSNLHITLQVKKASTLGKSSFILFFSPTDAPLWSSDLCKVHDFFFFLLLIYLIIHLSKFSFYCYCHGLLQSEIANLSWMILKNQIILCLDGISY